MYSEAASNGVTSGSIGDRVLVQAGEIAGHSQCAPIAAILPTQDIVAIHFNGDPEGVLIADHHTISRPHEVGGGASSSITNQSKCWRIRLKIGHGGYQRYFIGSDST